MVFFILNVFSSDTEKSIVKRFSGQLEALSDVSQKLNGKPCDLGLSYDFAMVFKLLPQIEILLLFNDRDREDRKIQIQIEAEKLQLKKNKQVIDRYEKIKQTSH